MTTRAVSISEVRSRLDDPYQQAPNLHKIVAGHLQFEQWMANKLNRTNRPWAVKTWTFTSDPDTDTYTIETASVPILDFGKPLVIVKATGEANYPFVQIPFDDYNQQEYGIVPPNVSEVGIWGLISPAIEKMSFYREGMINPTMKLKLNPVPQEAKTYTVSYMVGAIGVADGLEVNYGIPEHAHLIEVMNALARLSQCKWYEDPKMNRDKAMDLSKGLEYELGILMPEFNDYIRNLAHARPVEVNVCY